jgi:hypothetical protein
VGRIIPEVYSLVITRTPRTLTSSMPTSAPCRAVLVTLPALTLFLALAPAWPPIPAEAATVIPRVHQVERRLRSLIHSIRATCLNP